MAAEMDQTIMHRFCQLQRLMGNHLIVEEATCKDTSNTNKCKLTRGKQKKIELEEWEYDCLLFHVQDSIPDAQDYWRLPHPENAKILHAYVTPASVLKVSEFFSVSVLKPNNCVKFKKDGKVKYGFIRQIYEFFNPENMHETVLIVNPINTVFPKDMYCSSKDFRFILHLLKCVVGRVEDECVFFTSVGLLYFCLLSFAA